MTSLQAEDLITDLLARGHAVRFRAGGDSMDPLVRDGDVLHVEPAVLSGLRRGDVVLVRLQRGLTAHRVVEVQAGSVLTRGDNAPGADEPSSRVLGLVTSLERSGRRRAVRRLAGIELRAARWLARARSFLSR